MSSTNRSNARDKHIADYYITPQKAIKQFLKLFYEEDNINLINWNILDPCAWWDKDNKMSYPTVLQEYYNCKNIITNDIREDSPAEYHKDFLNISFIKNKYDLVITNPPFNIAQDIINKSLEVCKPWWYVVMLLRLNYFWWKCRQEFWKNNPPYQVYVHNRRMSFTPDWKTDSIEYMHCIWKKWYKGTTEMKFIYDF